jgi:hypothetical protein
VGHIEGCKIKKGKRCNNNNIESNLSEGCEAVFEFFEPLVKVLRLVDGDVKPSMGFLYGELLKAKREIKEAYGNVETRYKECIAIIDKKMKGRLDSPLHLTAYLLNAYYIYANPSIFDEPTK